MTTFSNPGAIPDQITATKIESTWGNAIRDRTVQNFATTSARDTAITAPVTGQTCYVTYAGAGTGLLTYAGATDGWQKPWNMPWGMVGWVQPSNPTSSSGTLADVSGGAVNFTAVANRLIKIYIQAASLTSTVSNDLGEISITDGSGSLVITRQTAQTTSTGGMAVQWVKSYSAGSQTAKIQVRRASGTGTLTFGAMLIVVEDIGPSGNPS